ncbi:MAG: acetyl-CoA C-acyltransferase [Saprospirales bacterium]|nr:acetyl-CoA C-acyltransferase [Saprospirales bacterium]|tara:strand:- start:4696 stop:5868 length:1173 start_codon:yes stop_codon:yes gene_type:complete
MKDVYVLGMARSPVGSFGGTLSKLSAVELGAHSIRHAVLRASVELEDIEEVYMGQVLQAGAGQAPARQAALSAGLPESTPCTTINKVCSSGMKSIMMASQSIRLGDRSLMVAGGMESMSQSPFYSHDARWGAKYGNRSLVDGIVRDGLQDPYDGSMMGVCGDLCADEQGLDRSAQDEYAIASYKRAQEASNNGWLDSEIAPIEIPQRKGDPVVISRDEDIDKVRFEKIPSLRPVFNKEGSVTAANASNINDGAAALVLASDQWIEAHKPLARIVSYADAAQKPKQFTMTPSLAMPLALDKAGLKSSEIDLVEINEAFSVVALANMKAMGFSHDITNVNGGGVSIGHPIGVSGCRIVMALVSELRRRGKRYGLAGICNGGGGASAMVIEAL